MHLYRATGGERVDSGVVERTAELAAISLAKA
jgi:hypothetical protein